MSLGVSGLGTILSGKNKISMSAKVNITSVDTGANNNPIISTLIDGTSFGIALNIDGTGGLARVRMSARSVTGEARQLKSGATAFNFGVDTYVGGVMDVAGDLIEVFLGGASDGSASVAFGNSVWTLGVPTGSDTIGGFLAPPATTPDQFAGTIAEIAIWASATDSLSAANYASLASGVPASSVRADILVYYLPIAGAASPELPTTGSPQGTITGSLPAVSYVQRVLTSMGCG